MRSILQVARSIETLEAGIYVIVDGEAKAGELSREAADKLLEVYPDMVKEFKDNEPIVNLVEWKKQNTVIKS